jgi:hypothetical protein
MTMPTDWLTNWGHYTPTGKAADAPPRPLCYELAG